MDGGMGGAGAGRPVDGAPPGVLPEACGGGCEVQGLERLLLCPYVSDCSPVSVSGGRSLWRGGRGGPGSSAAPSLPSWGRPSLAKGPVEARPLGGAVEGSEGLQGALWAGFWRESRERIGLCERAVGAISPPWSAKPQDGGAGEALVEESA